MFGVPSAGLPVVFRAGGAQTYHATKECTRLTRPARSGTKKKKLSPFDVEQAEAMGWRPCLTCAKPASG